MFYRSSQRPLLNSVSPPSDPTLLTSSYQAAQDNSVMPPFNHHYSVIRDSSQPRGNFSLPEHTNNIHCLSSHAALSEMTENEEYAAIKETAFVLGNNTLSLNEYDSIESTDTGLGLETSGYSKLGESVSIPKLHPPEYGIDNPQMLMPNEGYSALKQQNHVSSGETLAYNKLNPWNTTQTSSEDEIAESYSKLHHSGSHSSTSNGLVHGYELVDGAGKTKKTAKELFDDVRYSTIIHKPSSPVHDGSTQCCNLQVNGYENCPEAEKKKPILPPKYRGNYERDPNYEIKMINR